MIQILYHTEKNNQKDFKHFFTNFYDFWCWYKIYNKQKNSLFSNCFLILFTYFFNNLVCLYEFILNDLPQNNPKWWCKVEDGYILNLLGEKKNKEPYKYHS